MTQIRLIWAQSRNRVIGRDGGLPWHLPQDLAHFKQLTRGCPVIMGRKTWDSLPPRFRPLPERQNIVVTRNPDWQANGATVVTGLEQALLACSRSDVAWVIGGAQVYAQALPLASLAVVTHIDVDFEGDAFAPVLGPGWREVAREQPDPPGALPFAWVTYGKLP